MNNARNAYVGSMVQTASPARLLVMLYDRFVLDLQRAAECQAAAEHVAAGTHLMHAQDIVLELQSALRHDVWAGAAGLAGIYSWLHAELVRANVQRDEAATRACLVLVEQLASAWRQAALTPVDQAS